MKQPESLITQLDSIRDSDLLALAERILHMQSSEGPVLPKRLHRLLEYWQAIRSTKTDSDAFTLRERYGKSNFANLQVSRDCLPRAIAFADTLFKTLECDGANIVIGSKWQGQHHKETIISFCGQRGTAVRVRELLKQIPRPKEKKKSLWEFERKYDEVPTGKLVVDTNSVYQILCRDSERVRIEDKIPDLIRHFFAEAIEDRLRTRANVERERQAKERERILEERRQAQQRELQRVEQLIANSQLWKQSQILREFIQRVNETRLSHPNEEEQQKFSDWLSWARQQADRMDPLTPSPPSIIDDRI
jgi:hypothetical protein